MQIEAKFLQLDIDLQPKSHHACSCCNDDNSTKERIYETRQMNEMVIK